MRRPPARNCAALFRALTRPAVNCFSRDRKLYDIAAVAARDKWPSTEQYAGHLQQLIGQILVEGRQAGGVRAQNPAG
ncbi:transcriptional regulator TetR family [Klebsiella pneumoniae]|uniref:Transcriptional regulator TetR family n=1 Tax=Klebsiella pneumoniae TaxID=573 RepID=A0A377TZJ5_KLEPN|nr:transcriptional regulator TetR family [Klebsiella pneumoniae]